MTSVEKEMRQSPEEVTKDSQESMDLANWIKAQLGTKASNVKLTSRLESHPCVVTVEEMAAARHFIKTQGSNFTEEQRYNILQPQLEINPEHPIIKKLQHLKSSNAKLATLVSEQLFANAMVSAGLVEDPRTILRSMNDLISLALEPHGPQIQETEPEVQDENVAKVEEQPKVQEPLEKITEEKK